MNQENQEEVWQRLYGQPQKDKATPWPVGTRVRISKVKGLFEKGYLPNWSDELFTISKVLFRTDPITYKIKDDADEVVRGTFYREELQKVAEKEVYRISKILKTRTIKGKKEYLIRWYGYTPSFDSWVPKEAVQRYE